MSFSCSAALGTVLVGFDFNYNGTINGNAPVLIVGNRKTMVSASWRLDRLILEPLETTGPTGSIVIAYEAVLQWTTTTGQKFEVESSPDLCEWRVAGAMIREVAPGLYQARTSAGLERLFFRLMIIPQQQKLQADADHNPTVLRSVPVPSLPFSPRRPGQ